MSRKWALIVSDYRREYGMSCDDLAAINIDEFQWLLQGLSEHSRFAAAWRDEPTTLHDPAERAALIAAARR